MSAIINNPDLALFSRADSSAKILLDAHSTEQARRIVVANPSDFELSITQGAAQLVVVKSEGEVDSSLRLNVGCNARLDVVEVSDCGGSSKTLVTTHEHSHCAVTSIALGNASVSHTAKMEGADAEYEFSAVFVAGDGEKSHVCLRVEHNVADCRSNSVIKGVASGDGEGRFDGMVYVAPDAQRTDARQSSRNITMGERARIKALPQLEIYADDVKCSHGATVGQMDSDAVLYMRQRGLSEQMARRMQIEGFVADVLSHCEVAAMKDILLGELSRKMDTML